MEEEEQEDKKEEEKEKEKEKEKEGQTGKCFDKIDILGQSCVQQTA